MAVAIIAAGPTGGYGPACRIAGAGDRERVLDLFLAYLRDAAGDILPCPENLEVYGAIFDSYDAGEALGVTLLAMADGEVVGFTMAGEFPLGFKTSHGNPAMGWGTYVMPAQRRRGHARRLRRALDRRLTTLGFDAVIGGYAPRNGPAEASVHNVGFEIYQVLGVKRLKF